MYIYSKKAVTKSRALNNEMGKRVDDPGGIVKILNNVNARYLAHALLSEWSFSSACATLFGRRRKFFLAHALQMGKTQFF